MFGLESLMGANFFCERNFVRQIMLGDNYVLDYRNIIQNGKDLHDFDRHAVPFFLVALLLRIFYLAVKAKNNTATKSG